jgi:hypothetical protein
MTLRRDCSIAGTPLESGLFQFVVHVGASGVSNQLDWNVGFRVFGPSVLYDDLRYYAVGGTVDLAPINDLFWKAQVGESLTYSLASGSLPEGVVINSSTGHVTGQVRSVGTYSFTIRADVTSGGRFASAIQEAPTILVTALTSTNGYLNPTAQGWLGANFDIAPVLPNLAGASFLVTLQRIGNQQAGLPSGLTLEPSTGRIHGVPIEVSNFEYSFVIHQTYGSLSNESTGTVRIAIAAPVQIAYRTPCRVGQPCVSPPTLTVSAPFPYDGALYEYAMDPRALLPQGLSIDATSGVISGTAARGISVLPRINVRVTREGFSFVSTTLGPDVISF